MRRLLPRLFHPYATAVLLALLLADVWFLPFSASRGHFSTVGDYIGHTLLHRPYAYGFLTRPQMYVIRDPSGTLRLADPEVQSMDEITRELHGSAGDVLNLLCGRIDLSSGFWAPTTRVEAYTVITQFGEHLTADQRAAARRIFVEASGAASWLTRPDFQTYATTDIRRTRTLWLGYTHNILAIAALILFLLSLRWLPKSPAYIRDRIGAHRLARGLCPRCSYNLRGLRKPKCPECGTPIP